MATPVSPIHITLWGGAPSHDRALHPDSFHITINGHGPLSWYDCAFCNGSKQAYRKAFDLVRADGVMFRLVHDKRNYHTRLNGLRLSHMGPNSKAWSWCLDRCESPFTGLVALAWCLLGPEYYGLDFSNLQAVELRGFTHLSTKLIPRAESEVLSMMGDIPSGACDTEGNKRLYELILQELPNGRAIYHKD